MIAMGYSKGALIANPLSREEIVEAIKEEKDSLSKIIKAIHIFGPRNYTAISRITGIPVETVRYKINTQLRSKGVRIYAHIDYGKLGLARYTLRLKFNPNIEEYAPKILDKLAEIEYYGRILPRWEYLCKVALPPELELKYRVFLDEMVSEGIIEHYTMERMNNIRYLSMNTRFYDFKNDVWNIPSRENYNGREEIEISIEEDICTDPEIDSIDLKIIAWNQIDAYLSITDIAKKIMCNPKKALYHFKEHIIKRGIIKRYIVLFGWRSKNEINQGMNTIVIRFEDLCKDEIDEVRKIMDKIPFTIMDYTTNNYTTYVSWLLVPTEHLIPIFRYISEEVGSIRTNLQYDIIDPEVSQPYTIPYEMYEDGIGWRFNVNRALNVINEVLYSKVAQV